MTADAKWYVHVELKGPARNDCAQGIEQEPRVGKIQRHQLTSRLNVLPNDKVLGHGHVVRILWIIVLAGQLRTIVGCCKP